MPEQPTLSRAEASSFLGVSIRTIDRLGIPKVKLRRRTVNMRADLLTYLEVNRVQPIATPTVEPSREAIKAAVTGIAAKIKNMNTGEDPEARYRRRMAMLQAAA